MSVMTGTVPECVQSVRARREAAALARRQEALARLAARRMPLPGQPTAPAAGDAGRARRAGYPHRHRRVSTPAPLETPETMSRSRAKPRLTAREVEVLRTWLFVESKMSAARQLDMGLGTVNTHLTRIRTKYAQIGRPAPTKAALVVRAIQDQIVTLDEF